MRRRLLNLLTHPSLLLCAAVAVLWVRSYSAQDFLEHLPVTATPAGFRWWSFSVATWKGVVLAGVERHDYVRAAMPAPIYDGELHEARARAFASEKKWRSREAEDFPMTGDPCPAWGFTWQVVSETTPGYRGYCIGAGSPWWFVLLVCSTPVGLRTVSWLRRRRHGRRLCPTCGYDLRATPERCPECGTPPLQWAPNDPPSGQPPDGPVAAGVRGGVRSVGARV